MEKYLINPNQKISKISKDIYGHFSEHLGRCIYEGLYVGEDSPIPNVNGMRKDVVDALKGCVDKIVIHTCRTRRKREVTNCVCRTVETREDCGEAMLHKTCEALLNRSFLAAVSAKIHTKLSHTVSLPYVYKI